MIRAALKSLLGRKLRLLMSTFAIVLGVAFVAGSLVFSDTLGRSFTALFASTVGDVVVRPAGTSGLDAEVSTETVPAALVDRLAEVEGAARADGQVSAYGVFVIDRDGKAVGGFGAPALGGSWTEAPAGHDLEGLEIVTGRAPRGPEEVVLDAGTAERSGYAVGERIRVLTSSADAEQLVLEPRLVGVADFAEGGSLNGATLALFDIPTAQELFLGGRDVFNQVWVTAEDGVGQAQLRERVAEVLPDRLEAVTGDTAADESASALLEAVSFLTTFLLIFAGIAVVVSAFLIVNTFSILVAQRSRELALLRALGASRRQVSGSVLLEAFVLGLLGSTVGLGLGVLLAMGIRSLFATIGLDLEGQPLVFRPRTVLAAYAVGVLVTMAAAWLPARRTGRITPVQALRDDVALPETSLRRRFALGVALVVAGGLGIVVGLDDLVHVPGSGWFLGGGVLAVLLGVTAASPVVSRPFLLLARAAYAGAFGTVGHLAGQNSLRNPRRTTATASALMIGLALAGTMAIVGDSAKASVDKTIADNFVGDFVISNAFGGSFSTAIGDRIARTEGVQTVIRERFAFGEIDGDRQGAVATDPDDLDELGVELVAGSAADLRPGAVLLQESWADDRGLGVGDTVELDAPGGTQRWRVVGVFEDTPVVFFPVVTGFRTLAAAGYPPKDNAVIVFAEPGAGRIALQHRLDEVVAELPIVSVKDEAAFAEEQRAPIDQMVLMIFALLGLALVIAVLGIVNTLALSIIERTREVGLLRAIGLARSQLRLMIALESVVISLLGAVLGVLLGLGFGTALMYALRDEGLEVISVPSDQLAVFLALSLLIGVLAAVLPARRAARLDVLRAIATE